MSEVARATERTAATEVHLRPEPRAPTGPPAEAGVTPAEFARITNIHPAAIQHAWKPRRGCAGKIASTADGRMMNLRSAEAWAAGYKPRRTTDMAEIVSRIAAVRTAVPVRDERDYRCADPRCEWRGVIRPGGGSTCPKCRLAQVTLMRGQSPKVDGEQLDRELRERQAARRGEIRAKLKRINDARKAGRPVAPKDLGPLYP